MNEWRDDYGDAITEYDRITGRVVAKLVLGHDDDELRAAIREWLVARGRMLEAERRRDQMREGR